MLKLMWRQLNYILPRAYLHPLPPFLSFPFLFLFFFHRKDKFKSALTTRENL